MPFLHWDGHSAHVMRLVTKLYKNLEFFDCTLDTNGGLIHGHKTILVACSPYLKKLIMDHHGMEIIPLKEVKYNDMKLILDFVYFGEVEVAVTDVPSLMQTAQLLEITTLISHSLKFLEKSPLSSTSDQSMGVSGTISSVNRTNYDDCNLSEQEMRGIVNHDELYKNEDRLSAVSKNIDHQSICGDNTNPKNDLKELSQKSSKIHPKLSVQNCSMMEMDITSKGRENFHEELPPFAFVSVSPFSIKTEPIEDEQSATCVSPSELNNPMEGNPLNCDMMKEVKPFGSGNDEQIIGDNLTLKEVSESSNCGAETMSLMNFEQDMNQGLEVPNTKSVKIEEITDNFASSSTHNKTMGISQLDFEHQCGSSETQILITEEEMESEKCLNEEEEVPHSSLSSEICHDIVGRKQSVPFMDNVQVTTCTDKNKQRQQLQSDTLEGEKHTPCFDKHFSCGVCKLSFTNPYALKIHRRIHSGEKRFKCNVCGSLFAYRSLLERHMRKHTGEKPFKCVFCESSFAERGVLHKHLRVHTGEKPFKCDLCQFSFSQMSHLKEHFRTHTREKPFKCNICELAFSRMANLKVHYRVHTGDRPFKCDLCEFSCAHRISLTRHMQTHTSQKPFM